jgi:hypothetical protein
MNPKSFPDHILDPADAFGAELDRVWRTVSETYDVKAGVPDIQTLFKGVDLDEARQAARGVLVNMLDEIIQNVCRFSKWYTQPARAFGLTSVRDSFTHQTRWLLAPEAERRWKNELKVLERVIDEHCGLLQAVLLVDRLMEEAPEEDPYVVIRCRCSPERRIQVRRSILKTAELICDECKHAFA